MCSCSPIFYRERLEATAVATLASCAQNPDHERNLIYVVLPACALIIDIYSWCLILYHSLFF